MEAENIWAGFLVAMAALFLYFVLNITASVARNNVAQDCKALGVFMARGQVYECKPRDKS
jgi:hypothetical protein